MDRFRKWAKQEYSPLQRLISLFFQGLLFVVLLPWLLINVSAVADQLLGWPVDAGGWLNYLIALIFIVPGWVIAVWAVYVQFTVGRGTPAPIMATQRLLNHGPYTYCRNPMVLGTILFFLGIAIGGGSLSAVLIVLIFTLVLLGYIKLIEEKELAARFGRSYQEYKRRTPFIIPRFKK